MMAGCGGEEAPLSGKGVDQIAALPELPAVFACGAPATPIAALTRDPSLVRQQIMPRVIDVEGVVVGNFQGGLGGFFVQSADDEADNDPATAEGLFVEHRGDSPAPRVGQRMRVRGEWAASDESTRSELALRRIDSVLDCGPSALPSAIELGDAPADWSNFAGMRIRVPGPLTLTGNDTLLRYGELWLSFGDRLVAPTELVMPGGAATVRAEDHARRLLIADDGRGGDYPRRLWHLPAEPGPTAPYRAGSTVRDIQGILDRRFGGWRLQLTAPVGTVDQAPRPAPPARDPDLLRVASFNVLNYFNGDGQGGGFPTERGAGSRNDLRRQRDKLVTAMIALDADVYALMEIENDGFGKHSAVADLADALMTARAADSVDAVNGDESQTAGIRYAYVDAGSRAVGSDAIAVALIYRADRVQPIGKPLTLDDAPFDADSRVPLAQAFTAITSGDDGAFLVVVNHFKSKGCRDAQGDNRDAGDGQSCYAPIRTASARRLVDWLGNVPGGIGVDRALVLGDLNAHTREDAVRALVDRGFVDALANGKTGIGHSFVFAGQAGRLDHALAGAQLSSRIRHAGIWHINADELPEFDYDGDARSGRQLYVADAYRSSDHDPVYVDLRP